MILPRNRSHTPAPYRFETGGNPVEYAHGNPSARGNVFDQSFALDLRFAAARWRLGARLAPAARITASKRLQNGLAFAEHSPSIFENSAGNRQVASAMLLRKHATASPARLFCGSIRSRAPAEMLSSWRYRPLHACGIKSDSLRPWLQGIWLESRQPFFVAGYKVAPNRRALKHSIRLVKAKSIAMDGKRTVSPGVFEIRLAQGPADRTIAHRHLQGSHHRHHPGDRWTAIRTQCRSGAARLAAQKRPGNAVKDSCPALSNQPRPWREPTHPRRPFRRRQFHLGPL